MKKKETKDNNIKELSIALDKKIDQHKQKQLGGMFEKDGDMFKTKASFNSKSMSKAQYCQLFALYDFMLSNPKVTYGEIRRLLRSKSIHYHFLNKCDQEIDSFIEELKSHGPYSMALYIENQHKKTESYGIHL